MVWVITDSALVLQGDQKNSLLVEREEGSQVTMTSTQGCSLTPWVVVLSGRWATMVGFFFFFWLRCKLTSMLGQWPISAFSLEDKWDGLGRYWSSQHAGPEVSRWSKGKEKKQKGKEASLSFFFYLPWRSKGGVRVFLAKTVCKYLFHFWRELKGLQLSQCDMLQLFFMQACFCRLRRLSQTTIHT